MTQFVPETAEQLKDAVAWAVAEEYSVAVKGAGTKAGFGVTIAGGGSGFRRCWNLAGAHVLSGYQPYSSYG